MPTYIYKAKKGPKEIVTGELTADSQDQAVIRLDKMGLIPVKLVEQPGSGLRRQGSEKKKLPSVTKIRAQDLDIFTRQFAGLLRANVPMLRALSLIAQQTENAALTDVISYLEKRVKDGKTLSEAMESYPRIFNNLYLSLVRSGEKSGSLETALSKLAEYREKEQELKRKIQTAMAYPALMAIVGAGTIFVMLTYFLPKLTGLFESMHQALPLPTKILIGMSNFMSGNWYWFLIGLIFLMAVFGRVKPGSKKKFLFDLVKLYLPFMKRFITNAEIAKFSRTLATLLKNGISVYESLSLATDTLNNDVLKERLERAGREIIDQGATLSGSLKRIDIFPKFAVSMIAVGEEGGKLEESLNEIAHSYEKEVEQALKIMTTLLEPLLILIVGAVVGFIVFAMLLPIFNIGVGPG